MDPKHSGNKRGNSSHEDSLQTQDNNMSILSKETEDGTETKRSKQELNVFAMENTIFLDHPIVEKILSFLDVNSLKNARLVNKLWGAEGIKIIISKGYVKLPWGISFYESPRTSTTMEKFKAFLSCQLNPVSRIANIIIDYPGDVELWEYLEVLGPQVKSVKLNDVKAELLSRLLGLLPNLSYLSLKDTICKKETLTSLMSTVNKDGSLLVAALISLSFNNMEDLDLFEKFANCTNIMYEELEFSITSYHFNNPQVMVRVVNSFSKLLSTSRKTLKKLTLKNCDMFLYFLDFPKMDMLSNMQLSFFSHAAGPLHYQFSPSFKFIKNLPNLQDISFEVGNFEGTTIDRDFFVHLFEETGPASAVKRLKLTYFCSNLNTNPLLQFFPNVTDFHKSMLPQPYAPSEEDYEDYLPWNRPHDCSSFKVCHHPYGLGY